MAAKRSDPSPEVRAAFDAWRGLARGLRVLERAAERQSGLSAAQLFALRQVEAQPGCSLGDLAELTLTHSSSVSVVVQRLLEKGLLRRGRDPGDGRRAVLQLTPAGQARLRRSPMSADARLLAALGRLGPAEAGRLATTLARVLDEVLGASPAPVAAGRRRSAARARSLPGPERVA